MSEFLARHAALKTNDGRACVVRHGHLPEREVMTGIGSVGVRQPRVRDRKATADDPGRIRFSPSILPPYVRRSRSIETLLPILYLKGISTLCAGQRESPQITVFARHLLRQDRWSTGFKWSKARY